MKNPKFINLKKFNSDYINCDINDIISYVEQEKNVKRKYFKKK
jgi:DNA-binding Xre family transcriptional regulator